MLSPNPLSLLCALLLCLPLAVIFTTTANHKHATTANPIHVILNKPNPNLKNISISEKPNNKLQQPASPPPPDDDDLLLFRVATQVSAKPTWPKKIAFMFLTTTPLPFAPLWEIYFNQTHTKLFNVYVHADPTFSYHPPFSGVFSNRVILSKRTQRFSPTLVAAARRLLANALIHDPSNSVFVLLSPSCIPLHSFNFTYHALVHSGKSFIEILANETGSYDRWAARGPHAMLPEVKLEEFRIGSQFWALTRQHARLVVSDSTLWPKFNVPCVQRDTCYPDENYFPTLLNMRMRDPEECVPATLTHVNWTGRVDGHPRTYEAWEVEPELILRMKSDMPRYGDGNGNRRRDPFLFARKFAADALQPLMRIANDVVLRD
ncbi:glycosyltransferase BC10-like [Gastrolobium bilobum]|uniref:glycosyltransferase BC10-like n=1 Tax=Gastrolobium bilobum TaxID=150636 RepID=UPI002AB2741D|nr:glycosyltransferase BC10-like [Gastrolobium bilobum]